MDRTSGGFKRTRLIAAAQELKMMSLSRVIVVDAGRAVETPCEFHCGQFSMFENPVIWKKIQADEQTSINIMGNILEPFLVTQRFEVVLVSDHPRYQMSLRISSKFPYARLMRLIYIG